MGLLDKIFASKGGSKEKIKGVSFRDDTCSVCNQAVRAAVSIPGALIIAPVLDTKTSDIALYCSSCTKTICVKCASEKLLGGGEYQNFYCPKCNKSLGPHN